MKDLPAWRAAVVLALTLGTFPLSAAQDTEPAVPPRPLPGISPVPPPGIALPDNDRRALEEGLSALAQEVRRLRKDPEAAARLADVEIYYQAVRIAVDHQEFFDPADIGTARKLLEAGAARAGQLTSHQTPWLTTPGPTVLGYVSSLDGSVQPYGLYLPPTFTDRSPQRWRLDTWFHGRDEKLSEVRFISGVAASGGPFVRPDALVLSPYGRYCNGSKLAGEVDFFEALADLRRRFRIDDDRIVIRGFSLGGASAWHLGAHFAADWAAVAPGAGFAETPAFLRSFAKEELHPAWWEEKLYGLYDAPAYAENFRNVAVVAYSGELDAQRQAADLMAAALAKVGVPLVHVIGPQTRHSYHPEAVASINRLVDALAARGRDPLPRRVSLATPTLKYNRQAWVVVDGITRHWQRATVDAEIDGEAAVSARTHDVTALSFDMPAGRCPFPLGREVAVRLDGQRLVGPHPRSDRSWTAHFHRAGARWQAGELPEGELRKRHDLQGPIDDAFMSGFVMVTPSGKAASDEVGKWALAEQMRALREWRRQMRGEPRARRDIDLSAEEIAAHNLVLWGDPASNTVWRQIASRLPIQWTADAIVVGKRRYPGGRHALVAVYPNPLNPRRYVVLNSGFTFREYDYLNNARQIPKLPDWAVVDIGTPADGRAPGKIVDAGFFGERWELVTSEAAK
jgi:prolyl oligopeptidase family protein